MDTSTKVLASLLSRVRGRTTKQSVREKVVACKCLQCGAPAVTGCRGLCEFCHGQFKYARSLYAKFVTITRDELRLGLTLADKIKAKKREFDDREVAQGHILRSQQGKHGRQNPFRVVA